MHTSILLVSFFVTASSWGRANENDLHASLSDNDLEIVGGSSAAQDSTTFNWNGNIRSFSDSRHTDEADALPRLTRVFLLFLLSLDDFAAGWQITGHSRNFARSTLSDDALESPAIISMSQHRSTLGRSGLHDVHGLICREVPINVQGIVSPISILEATSDTQKHLVNLAVGGELDATTVESSFRSLHDDPYGSVLWPAALATANYLLALGLDLSDSTVLELGAGTGLVSLAASHKAKQVVATDYEESSLALLRHSVDHLNPNAGEIKTSLFDVTDFDVELPDADIVVAADMLYLPKTGHALAKRVFEAIRRGSRVIVSDTGGRAGKPAFLKELRILLDDTTIDFTDVMGTTCQGPRHDLIQGKGAKSVTATPQPIPVGILDLQAPEK